MNSRTLLFGFLFLLGAFNLKAQHTDFQLWTQVEATAKLNKQTRILLEQEVRFFNNAKSFSKWVSVIGLGYKLNKNFRVRAYYRFDYGYDLETQSQNEQRLYGDLIFRYNIVKRLRFSFRSRYQVAFEGYLGEEFGTTPRQYWRNKFALKYNIPKVPIDVDAAGEFYFSTNNPIENSVEKWRFTFGAAYKISKEFSLTAYYRYQQRRSNYQKPLNLNVLGLGAQYDF